MHCPVPFYSPWRQDRFGLNPGKGETGDMLIDRAVVMLILPDVRMLAVDPAMADIQKGAVVTDGKRSSSCAAAVKQKPKIDLTDNVAKRSGSPD